VWRISSNPNPYGHFTSLKIYMNLKIVEHSVDSGSSMFFPSRRMGKEKGPEKGDKCIFIRKT
jgi:hypothetical protein